MATIRVDYEYTLWTGVKAYCPICKNIFTSWYCPTCGLPKKNSKYAVYKGYTDSIHNCGNYHFRPEYSQFEDFNLCSKCYTTNPFNAKYCRNCKNRLTASNGVTKDAHGWVDLGLSVLWATETMEGKFRWMSCKEYYGNISGIDDDDLNYRGGGKDAASEIWGQKWRTPTKEEFEELFTKCRWERCIDSISKKYALKATGPNGNSIILTLVNNDMIGLWTSTEYDSKFAYALRFINDIKIEKTLTAKQKKEREFAIARSIRENEKSKIEDEQRKKLFYGNATYSSILNIPGHEREIEKFRNKWKDFSAEQRKREDKEREIQRIEQNILNAMGDDRQERENNEKKDKEKLDKLWISSPVKLNFNEDNKYKRFPKRLSLQILPVADKKWLGKL